MIHRALRRARTRYWIVVVAALFFVAGVLGAVGVTSAFFKVGFDTKTATFADGYLAVPTIAAVYPSAATTTIGGYDGGLVWTNGTDQTTTANEIQQIFGADQGATSNCTGASYSTTVASSITSPTTTTTFTYTDSNRGSGSINGDWYCYEVVHGWPTTTAPVWTAGATTNVRIGLTPTGVAITSGGGANQVSNNDTIVITYNQPVTMTSNTFGNVCQFQTEGVILIGDTTCSPSSTAGGDAYTFGKINITVTNGGEHSKKNATITVGSPAANQITVKITQNGSNVSGGATFVSSTNGGTVVSLATTDRATACTSGPNCTVTATGNF
jgi:hypothetical protein